MFKRRAKQLKQLCQMQFRAAALRVALILLCSSGAATSEPFDAGCMVAETSPEPAVTRSVLNELIGWIALRTDYDVSAVYRDPPEIVFCHVGEIVEYEAEGLLVDEILAAAYDLTKRRIYLVEPWSAEDSFDLSVLLHELIHAVQLDNRDWPCTGAPEWEAYMLQSVWLRYQGIVADFDWNTIYRLSKCPTGTGN